MKQETLKEDLIFPLIIENGMDYLNLTTKIFNNGAKWQQEQILQFLYSEIIERRPYSSSKMCEVVIEFIEQLNTDKITSNTTSTNLSFKAKAQELVDKMYFSRKYKEGEDYVPSQAWAHAKQCAFIAVEEILSMSIMGEYGMEFTKQYWEKIRRELIMLIGTDEK